MYSKAQVEAMSPLKLETTLHVYHVQANLVGQKGGNTKELYKSVGDMQAEQRKRGLMQIGG